MLLAGACQGAAFFAFEDPFAQVDGHFLELLQGFVVE